MKLNLDQLTTCWPRFPLGNLVDFLDSQRRPIKASERTLGPYPYYGANGLQDHVEGYLFDEKLVLLAEDGGFFFDPVRSITYIVEGKCWVNNHAHVLRARQQVIPEFLNYQLGFANVKTYLSGSTRAKLTKSDASRIEVICPPLSEQRRIVDLLSRAEGIVRLRREAEKKAAELIPALFLDMFGNPATNPKGWPVMLLGDLAANEKYAIKAGPFGSALKKEMYVPVGYKIYGQEQVIRDDLSYGDYFIDEAKFQQLENCKIQAHDLLISLVGTFGKISVVPENFQPGIINPRLMKITLDQTKVLPQFMKALLTGTAMRGRIEERSHGGTMSIVNVGIMKSLHVFVPPLPLQNQFRLSADAMLSVQAQQSTATAKAQATFDAMLAQAFS